jgi:hypothetical protein
LNGYADEGDLTDETVLVEDLLGLALIDIVAEEDE